MRREVPKRIDIGTDPAQVETLAVNVADFSQLTRVDELFHISDGSVVNKSVSCHDDKVPLGSAVTQFVHLAGFRGQRFFHKDVFASAEYPFRHAEVGLRWSCYDHGTDFRVFQNAIARFDRARLREVSLDKGASVRALIRDIFHRAVRQYREVPQKVRPPVSAPELR